MKAMFALGLSLLCISSVFAADASKVKFYPQIAAERQRVCGSELTSHCYYAFAQPVTLAQLIDTREELAQAYIQLHEEKAAAALRKANVADVDTLGRVLIAVERYENAQKQRGAL